MTDLSSIVELVPTAEVTSDGLAPVYPYNHRVTGTVKVNGVAAKKMVMIFNRETMQMLNIKESAADGSFEFVGLPEARLPVHPNGILVLTIDSNEGFNAEVADKIEAVGIGEAI